MDNQDYIFTKDWFDQNTKQNWDKIIPVINPKKILEIGCYEGAASCYLIEKLSKNNSLEIHCVDTWSEDYVVGEEDRSTEKRFDHNLKLAINKAEKKPEYFKHKAESHLILCKMVSEGVSDFDLIYIDASHYAVDVLTDAVLSFRLLNVGGMIIFDDYLWSGEESIVYYPKIAIDFFTNIFSKQLKLLPAPITQIYAIKTNEFINERIICIPDVRHAKSEKMK